METKKAYPYSQHQIQNRNIDPAAKSLKRSSQFSKSTNFKDPPIHRVIKQNF